MNIFKPLHEMTSLPDKPFRDSLENYKKAPPPQAWDRIESGLHKKKTRSIWMSIAASAFILISASFILLRSDENKIDDPYTASGQKNQTEIMQESPVALSTPEPIASPGIEFEPTFISKSQKPISSRKGNLIKQDTGNSMAIVSNENPHENSMPETAIAEITSTSTEEPGISNEIASTTSRSNKIIYSSGEVNSRFLKKENTNPASVINKSPDSIPGKAAKPIQKIIDIAANLKYEENALGELREMKNEILSLPRKEVTGDKK
jgi:hypothetical protein